MLIRSTAAMLGRKIFGNPSTGLIVGNKRLKTDDSQTGLLDLSLENCQPGEVSKYFPNSKRTEPLITVESKVLEIQLRLTNNLRALDIIKPPIEYVYNPLEYAFKPNEIFIRKYCKTKKQLLFVGINPGPFGMCQTGVPFGDPKWVRNWLKVEAEVGKPQIECPDRRISGFSSEKSEVSGHKFWGYFSNLCGSPENFFKYSFVANYCPLAFMKHDGGNITPGEIKNIQDRNALESVCEEAYLALIELLEPEIIIAIGRYMETKTKNLLQRNNIQRRVLYMPHPSPRVVNHHKWPEKVTEFLQENNLLPFFTRE